MTSTQLRSQVLRSSFPERSRNDTITRLAFASRRDGSKMKSSGPGNCYRPCRVSNELQALVRLVRELPYLFYTDAVIIRTAGPYHNSSPCR